MKEALQSIIEALGALVLATEGTPPDHLPVRVTNNSREASTNTLFTAIKGSNFDGHSFIHSAISAGSKLIVCENLPSPLPDSSFFIVVSNSYSAYAKLAEFFYGYPSEKLTLAGITGTNGKTTTAYLLYSILNNSNIRTGLISTVEYNTGNYCNPAERTTPDALELQKLFNEMNSAGCTHAVMEVSSHSLDQNRTGSAKFAVGIFSNISGDHLDYHNDMSSYFTAKKKLFTNHISKDGASLINIDDAYGEKLYYSLLKNPISKCYSYGVSENADFRISKINLAINKSSFSLALPSGEQIEVTSPLCGRFNIYNTASAVAAAHLMHINPVSILRGIANMPAVPGRMEKCSGNPLVFVDYAHTDDALGNVLSTISELLSNRKLTLIFGCGGDRDRTKRPRMGSIAAKFADTIIITDDNPRTEDPERIVNDIVLGIPKNKNFSVIHNRKEAIYTAINEATADTVILIAGKGHENYQEINGIKYPFNDKECVQKITNS